MEILHEILATAVDRGMMEQLQFLVISIAFLRIYSESMRKLYTLIVTLTKLTQWWLHYAVSSMLEISLIKSKNVLSSLVFLSHVKNTSPFHRRACSWSQGGGLGWGVREHYLFLNNFRQILSVNGYSNVKNTSKNIKRSKFCVKILYREFREIAKKLSFW